MCKYDTVHGRLKTAHVEMKDPKTLSFGDGHNIAVYSSRCEIHQIKQNTFQQILFNAANFNPINSIVCEISCRFIIKALINDIVTRANLVIDWWLKP